MPLAVLKVGLAPSRLMPPPEVLLALLQKTRLPLLVWNVRLSVVDLIFPRALKTSALPAPCDVTFVPRYISAPELTEITPAV